MFVNPTAILHLLTGLAWTVRSVMEVTWQPRYWDAATPQDHAAIWLFSLALALLAASVWRLSRDADGGRTSRLVAMITAIAVANAVEDAGDVRWVSSIYVAAALLTIAGLLALTVALAADRPRHARALLAWLVGTSLQAFGLGFVVLIGSLLAIRAGRWHRNDAGTPADEVVAAS